MDKRESITEASDRILAENDRRDESGAHSAEAGGGDGLSAAAATSIVSGASASAPPADRVPYVPIPRATEPREVAEYLPSDDPRLYFNRELSWLDFNWRVLYQALDVRMPLLERVRFVAITASNLDEFVRKRVGGLMRQAAAGVTALSPDGRTPQEQLALLRKKIKPLHERLTSAWEDELKSELRRHDIVVCDYQDLSPQDLGWMRRQFMANIFPILTPLAVDPGHPFPFISNQSLSLAVALRHPVRGTEHFARIKVPTGRGRWIQVPRTGQFVALEQVIANNVSELFRGMEIDGVFAFRITRNADVKRDEEEADDLLELISEELRERRFAAVVRLEIEANTPEKVRRLLCRELDLEEVDVFEVRGMLDLTALGTIADVRKPELQFEPWEPVVPWQLEGHADTQERTSMFDAIRQGDLLVHHPYESFSSSVQRFIEDAADDPNVLAIKLALYRTSSDSPIVRTLVRAAELGKQVAVLVEVKARFDEQNNMEWGQQLEAAGVHVTYGLVGLKTHSKATVVIREEEEGVRVYCHLGTGNYNASTARLYTDLGLFTCDPVIGLDAVNLFHYLTGYAPQQQYRELVVAPRDMRRMFIERLHREIENQHKYGNGLVMAKMNALDDVEMIRELLRASQAGVRIELVVRGHCRLRPGLKGISENIRVISILGRFLEHSRVYYFHNNAAPIIYIGSADWQRRNLDDRVEAVIAVKDGDARERIINTILMAINDRRQAWDLASDGRYRQRIPSSAAEESGFHQRLMQAAVNRRAVAREATVVG